MSSGPKVTADKVWMLSDGKAGDEAQCAGIIEAMGLVWEHRLIAPRRFYAWLMPFGPIDPMDRPHLPGSPLTPPYPDIAVAAGRRTAPYLRKIKTASGGRTFTVFVKDPYTGRRAADVIWVPQHDRLRGDNVLVTSTPAHRISAARLEAARQIPDSRIAGLGAPRMGMILGGPSQHHHFSTRNEFEITGIARDSARSGWSVLVTGSRRTQPSLLNAVRAGLADSPGQHFIWDGTGDNPYISILADSDCLFVTGDSVNMMAEAVATGAPVHIYEPDGGHRKITSYINMLITSGAARRWDGSPHHWTYKAIDATPFIAAAIAKRYAAWRSQKD